MALDPSKARRRAKAQAFVARKRKETVCALCGGQPVEWHHCQPVEKHHERISALAVHGASIARLKEEMARCEPLCRRCHMIRDGRMGQGRFTEGTTRGLRNPSAKLTAKQVRAMRRLYATGCYTMQDVGKKYGISPSQSRRILNGQSWKHLL